MATDEAITEVAIAIRDGLVSSAETDQENIVDGLFAIARAIQGLAHQVKYLGNGNSESQFGAIEHFGMHIGGKLDALTEAISSLQKD